jgi:hypothetical protein
MCERRTRGLAVRTIGEREERWSGVGGDDKSFDRLTGGLRDDLEVLV